MIIKNLITELRKRGVLLSNTENGTPVFQKIDEPESWEATLLDDAEAKIVAADYLAEWIDHMAHEDGMRLFLVGFFVSEDQREALTKIDEFEADDDTPLGQVCDAWEPVWYIPIGEIRDLIDS